MLWPMPDLPFKNDSCDGNLRVIARALQRPDLAVKEMNRVLKKGLVYISVPFIVGFPRFA